MAAALLAGRLFLAAVFTVAAVAKLRDLPASRRALAGFGIPSGPAAVAGTVLPFAELGVALGLLAPPVGPAAALAGFALLVAFCLAIVANLARGRAPECNCFGQLHSAPASWRTVARNVVLAAIAIAIAAGAGAPASAGAFAAAGVTVLVPAGAFAWWRGRAEESGDPGPVEGLPAGTRAPRFSLPALSGDARSLDSLLRPGRPLLLLFTDRNCGPCIELAPEVARWQRDHGDELAIAVIENESNGAAPVGPDEHGRRDVLVQQEGAVSEAYGVPGTPSGVLVGAGGEIVSEVAAGATGIEALISGTVQGFEPRARSAASAFAQGPPLRRRELFVRAGGAWAATGFVLAWPARTVVALAAGQRPCPKPWQLRCGGECISVLIDERRCGTNCSNLKRCERTPNRREICSGGRCIRDTDGSRCDAARRTGAAKGSEGAVPPGQCPDQMICCQGNCVDPTRSPNCGGCGGSTPPGRRPACCQGAPRDVGSDPRHCGRCFNRCPKDKPLCYAPPGTDQREACRATCGPRLSSCGTNKCFNPRTELCCSGKVIPKQDELHGEAGCCEEDQFFDPRGAKRARATPSPCPPPGAPPASAGYWYCRNGVCTCPIGPSLGGPCPD